MGALSSFAGSTLYTTVGTSTPLTGIAAWFPTLGTGLNQIIATDQEYVSNITGTTFLNLMRSLQIPGAFEQSSLVLAGTTTGIGALFGVRERDYWTYQGSTASAWQFSLGKPVRGASAGGVAGGTAMSGPLVMYFSLVRQDGFFGPARAITYPLVGTTAVSFNVPSIPNLVIGRTGSPVGIATSVSFGSFGLSGIQMWAQLNQGPIYQYGGLLGPTLGNLFFTLGFGFTGTSFFANGTSWALPFVEPEDFQGAMIYGLGITQGGIDGFSNAFLGTRINPQCIEYYNDRMWSAIQSRVIFSNPGTPEMADYENNFFVAQNDPTQITNMKGYFTQLVIWKFGSTWQLSGNTTDSFDLTQCTGVYGCISKNAACVWEQKLWFLDSKGVCEFNGANTGIVSNKVEDYFKRMNVDAASKVATMVHVKERNEVWTGIPVDGATMINLIVTYDYLSDAWGTRTVSGDNYSFLSAFALGANKPVPYYGSYSGMVGTYGNSLIGDNGAAFTCIIKSRFITQFGNSIEAMYRRLYLDVSVPEGETFNFLVNLYADKGLTPYYSVTMSVSGFQKRIDFGVPARSMAAEIVFSENKFLQLNGFTIESRFQRNC